MDVGRTRLRGVGAHVAVLERGGYEDAAFPTAIRKERRTLTALVCLTSHLLCFAQPVVELSNQITRLIVLP